MESVTITIGDNANYDSLEKELQDNIPFLGVKNTPNAAELAYTLLELSVTELIAESETIKLRVKGETIPVQKNRIMITFPRDYLTLEEAVRFAKGLDVNEMEAISSNCVSLWWD